MKPVEKNNANYERKVYFEQQALANAVKNPKFLKKLEPLHKAVIKLNPDYVCQVDGKFGVDLLKIKSAVWKAQLYNLVTHHLYQGFGEKHLKMKDLIEFTVCPPKSISGEDMYEVVFVKDKPVNMLLIDCLIQLASKHVVIPLECCKFDINQYPHEVFDGDILVFSASKEEEVEQQDEK